MPYFGNQKLSIAWLSRLGRYFEFAEKEEEDVLYLKANKESYTPAEVMEIAQMLAESKPDECDLDGDWLRLWWD